MKRRKTTHNSPDSDEDDSDSASFNHATTDSDKLESSEDTADESNHTRNVPGISEQSSSSKGLNGTEFINNKVKKQPFSTRQPISNRESTRSGLAHTLSGTAYVGEV